MNKYLVELDPTKCLSYTLPDGRKFCPGRSKVISESDVDVFRSAGVFLVSLHSSDESKTLDESKVLDQLNALNEKNEKSEDKKVRFKKRKVSSPEINPDDKLDVEEDKEDFV